MAWSIGIHLGENIIEIAATQEKALLKRRIFSSYLAPETALTQFFTQNEITEIERLSILTHLPLQVVEAGIGSPPAVLTTAGFENWMELSTLIETPFFSLKAERPRMPTDRELIFGVQERTKYSGEIVREISNEDLEFLIAKLELHGIKNVAICFLHSNQNPKNEEIVAEALAKKGIRSFISSKEKSDVDIHRFWAAIVNAYVTPYLTERLTALDQVIRPLMVADKKFQIGDIPVSDFLEGRASPTQITFSLNDFIAEQFAFTTPVLYCGLEEFFLVPAMKERAKSFHFPFGDMAGQHRFFCKSITQPLCVLTRGYFSEMVFTNAEIRMDPGPMIFGRGLQPTFLDLIYLVHKFKDIQGFDERIQEKGVSRLTEILGSYVKNTVGRSGKKEDFSVIAQEIIEHAIYMCSIRQEMNLGLGPLKLIGPLAKPVYLELKKFRKDLECHEDDFLIPETVLTHKKNRVPKK